MITQRFNIHKSGREIDIEAHHRTENRRVIAECKATASPIGGDEINKSVGALDAERRQKPNVPTTGYFISLSGFTETAREQEQEAGNGRVILLDGNEVINQLVSGNIVISLSKAMERAGECAALADQELRVDENADLIAHESGWIWAIYFGRNKKRSHFAVLVHADGEPLAVDFAQSIVESDRAGASLPTSLKYLAPSVTEAPTEQLSLHAQQEYFKFLESEYGEFTFEGLPADEEVVTRRLRLEDVFVPLHVQPAPQNLWQQNLFPLLPDSPEILTDVGMGIGKKPLLEKLFGSAKPPRPSQSRIPFGAVLKVRSRIAVLAPPGGGKSTLLKRLAIAYAFPARRARLDDVLPNFEWLPLMIRCRQLKEFAESPISDILKMIPRWAEMPDLREPFEFLVNRALREGRVLLLIDGLDEIASDSSRVAFVRQLRTFLSRYPQVSVVVTSREAGFRVVGDVLANHCDHFRIAEFDEYDITRVTVAWHREIEGDKDAIRAESEKLATSICSSARVFELARNPLLLTTILMVHRWVGHIPTKRTVLYEKGIEVLLMTWNVEAHEPLDREEVIPQLAFVSYVMMTEGIQRISEDRLRAILKQAQR